MRNKIELKKALVYSIFVIILMTIVLGFLEFYQYKVYTNNFNQKIGSILTKIQEEYPDMDLNDIMAILNSEEEVDSDFFRKYGIELEKDAIVLENDTYFTKFFLLNTILVILLASSIILIFLIYHHRKDKKLNEITKYLEQINQKNYKLDIEDNTEDELSILKNEIYKVTVMLKEVAENSVKDKVQLKDSLSDISHQLKTPLTSISVLLDNILDNPDMDAKTRTEFIKDIRREIFNIQFLVEAILKLSKLDANSVSFMKKEIKVEELINKAIQKVSVLCDLKNMEMNVKGDSTITINCDLKWQVEAITNILKNGIEHSKENAKIDICYEKNQLYTKIEIRDYGAGIDSKDLPHIFERFYKGKNSSSESVGIGLALAKSIIESNNGYIGVESDVGQGSRFVIKYFE